MIRSSRLVHNSLLMALGLWFCVSLLVDAAAYRSVISLDGQWQIADGISATQPPTSFSHTVAVPGLANLALPSFPKVDAFYSREHLANRIRARLAPENWLTNYWAGKVEQDRNYFWYRKMFRAPKRTKVVLLKINKAQFGTAVWLNGRKLGEYAGCFSASYFHLENAIHWEGQNNLLIRIGAHPAVLPDNYPVGSDFEKIKWTSGIYDSVSVLYCQNPFIESVQVAPRLRSNEVVVQTRIRNSSEVPAQGKLRQIITTWKGAKAVAQSAPEALELAPGEQKTVTQTIAMSGAHLWSPEDPFLYVVESSTEGDLMRTRFGMREFQFDGPTQRAYLNGKVYYLRGSNITLHRFFEDPLCKDLPWRESWVRELLGEVPKKMHWNY